MPRFYHIWRGRASQGSEGLAGTEPVWARPRNCPFPEPEEECGPCEGKITELTLQYNGLTAANIKVLQKKDSVLIFDDTVEPGELFTFVGPPRFGPHLRKLRAGLWLSEVQQY